MDRSIVGWRADWRGHYFLGSHHHKRHSAALFIVGSNQ
jgi:hypothetical protein